MPSDNYSGSSSDLASDFQSATSDLGQKAGAQIDSGRNAAASGIAAAADTLNGRANDLPGGARVAGFAHGAADKLNATAEYIRGHDVSAMVEDVKAIVKKNPVPALVGAAALGFLLAKAFSRD